MSMLAQRVRTPNFLLVSVAWTVLLSGAPGCASLGGHADRDDQRLVSFAETDIAKIGQSQIEQAWKQAEAAERDGKDDIAVRSYETVRQLDPSHPSATRRLAVHYDRRGDDVRADAAYHAALRITPDDADLLNDVGVFHLRRENWGTAEAYLRQAAERAPGNRRTMTNLAVAVGMQGKYEESRSLFEPVVGIAGAHSNLGVIMARRHETEGATKNLEQALALDPTIRPARELLAHLQTVP